MTSHPKFIAAIVAAAVSTMAVAQTASGQTATTSETEQVVEAKANSISIPVTGFAILEGVHNARLALSAGDIDVAKKLITDASDQFDERIAEIAMKMTSVDGYAIPVDSGLQFAEGFEPTEEHAPAIMQAGALVQQGNVDGAVKVMADAGVDLDFKVVILPVELTSVNLKQALADIEAGQFEKAAMALEAVGTSVLVEDYNPNALPHQGYSLTEILQG